MKSLVKKRFVCASSDCSQFIFITKYECASCGRVYCTHHGPQHLVPSSSLAVTSSHRSCLICLNCSQKILKKQLPGVVGVRTEEFRQLRTQEIHKRNEVVFAHFLRIAPNIRILLLSKLHGADPLDSLMALNPFKNLVITAKETWNTCGECHEYFDRFSRTQSCSFCNRLFCTKCNVKKKSYTTTSLDRLLRTYSHIEKNFVRPSPSSSVTSEQKSVPLSKERLQSSIPKIELVVTCCKQCRSTVTILMRHMRWLQYKDDENTTLLSSLSHLCLETFPPQSETATMTSPHTLHTLHNIFIDLKAQVEGDLEKLFNSSSTTDINALTNSLAMAFESLRKLHSRLQIVMKNSLATTRQSDRISVGISSSYRLLRHFCNAVGIFTQTQRLRYVKWAHQQQSSQESNFVSTTSTTTTKDSNSSNQSIE